MAGSFDLATGYVTFKGSFEQYEKDIAKAEEKLEALKKADMTGQFKMAAYAAKGVNDQLEKAYKNAKRMTDEVKYGKMGVLFRDAAAGMQAFQRRMQAFGTFGMGVGAAAIGAGSIASPLAADTLGGSMKLLTATIGKEFMPLMAQAAATVQNAARAWNGLNQSVKDSIGETVKMTAVAGAGALALVGVGRALSFIAAHPILTAIGAGVGAGSLINARNDKLGNEKFQGLQKEIAGINVADVLDDAASIDYRGMDREKALKQSAHDVKFARAEYLRRAEESNNYQKGWFGGGGLMGGLQRGLDWTGGKERQLIQAAAESQANMVKAEIRHKGLLGDPSVAGGGVVDQIAAGAVAGGKKTKDGSFLTGSMGPSSYSSLQDFYRSMNLATTGTSSLDAELLKLQLEANKMFLSHLGKMDTLIGKSGKAS